jgi:hypothetical protein
MSKSNQSSIRTNDSNDSTPVFNPYINKGIIYSPNNSESKKLTPVENSPNFKYTSNEKISNDLLPKPSDEFNYTYNNKNNYLNNSLNNRNIEDSPTFKKIFYTTNLTRKRKQKQKQKRKRKPINKPNRISQKTKKNTSLKIKKPFK